MKKSLLIITLLYLFAITATADEKLISDKPSDYANKLTIAIPETPDGMARVKLPLAIYRGMAHTDARDVRVFNSRGERVPYAFTQEPSVATDTVIATILPHFPLLGEEKHTTYVKLKIDGSLVAINTQTTRKAAVESIYLVDASRLKSPINALQFDWIKNPNVQTANLNIEASNDLKNWRSVARDAPLFDLAFAGNVILQNKVSFAPINDKYLRLTWGTPSAGFALTKISADSTSSNSVREVETISVKGTLGNSPGEYFFEVDAKLPIESAQLLMPDTNTLAPTRLYVKSLVLDKSRRAKIGSNNNIEPAWQSVANATFYNITRNGKELISPAVPTNIAATRAATTWRAVIDTRGGGLGSTMPTLVLTWQPAQIIFAARGEPPFTISFGRTDAVAAHFQVNEIMPGYKDRAEFLLPVATIATTTSDAASITPVSATVPNATDWKKIALWAVLIVGVALMMWMAIRLGRAK
jgi:Protein of unknown function (DUF3999)